MNTRSQDKRVLGVAASSAGMFSDIEDLRLPLAMVRTDWYAGKWNVMTAVIPNRQARDDGDSGVSA